MPTTRRASFLLLCALCLTACSGRVEPVDDAGRDGGTDAGALDAGVDAGSDAAVDPPDSGPGCEIDCPELPDDCYYVDPDCENGECGTPMCPDPDDLCGGLFHGFCPSGEWCDFFLEGACGTLDEIGVCRPRPDSCATGAEPVCGCDYVTYESACEAQRAGRDVAFAGACPAPDPCRGFDAFGEGESTDVLGWKWNGSTCETVIGSTCAGSDCARLEPDEASCEATFTDCIAALCDAQDAASAGTCDMDLGWAWTGTACVLLRGCTCEGAECWRIEGNSESDCESEFARCAPAPT